MQIPWFRTNKGIKISKSKKVLRGMHLFIPNFNCLLFVTEGFFAVAIDPDGGLIEGVGA
jgi:hypothetical protein